MRIGYVPISPSLAAPGDRRRFVNFANSRGIAFEIADPSQDYDIVVLSSLADISVWSRYNRGKVVYDLIDSYLAIPRTDIKGCLRGLAKFVTRQNRYLRLDYWRAIQDMCRRADAVVCSTEEQRHQISVYCSNVHIILDSHKMDVTMCKERYALAYPIRIVWEGLPQTLSSLKLLRPVLSELGKRYPLELHLVTDSTSYRYLGRYGKLHSKAQAQRLLPSVNIFLHQWTEDTFSQVISSCDFGVIPLSLDDRFAAGKPENKLLLLWRIGIPVVVSATPAYSRAMQRAGLSFACKDNSQWLNSLEHLISKEEARIDAASRGKAYADTHFSDDKLLACWDKVIASLGYSI